MVAVSKRYWAITVAALCLGCPDEGADDDATDVGEGSSDDTDTDDEAPSASSGQVTEEWSDYCVATFDEDTDVWDVFGDVIFSARAGERYLLTFFGNEFGEDRATLGYLTPDGPYEIDITREAGAAFPFTSNCTFDSVTQYYAAFADVTLYTSAELTTPLCSLTAGTVYRQDPARPTGFALAGALDLTGPSVYEIQLNAFAPLCNDAGSGFAQLPQTQVLDTSTIIIPVLPLVGP